MFEQHFLQISSNSEMVELEPFVELTRNDPVAKNLDEAVTVLKFILYQYSTVLVSALLYTFRRMYSSKAITWSVQHNIVLYR